MSDVKVMPLECPWCGGRSELQECNDGYSFVFCDSADCEAFGPCGTAEEAIAKWNRVSVIVQISGAYEGLD